MIGPIAAFGALYNAGSLVAQGYSYWTGAAPATVPSTPTSTSPAYPPTEDEPSVWDQVSDYVFGDDEPAPVAAPAPAPAPVPVPAEEAANELEEPASAWPFPALTQGWGLGLLGAGLVFLGGGAVAGLTYLVRR